MNTEKQKLDSNWDKVLVLRLLEAERYKILNHWKTEAEKVDPSHGEKYDRYVARGIAEAGFINNTIARLELNKRESVDLSKVKED